MFPVLPILAAQPLGYSNDLFACLPIFVMFNVLSERPPTLYSIGWVDLGVLGKKCFDFFGLQETVSRNSYMTPGLYRYSLAQPAILPPAQHMRGTSKMGSFNLSVPKRIFDK